MNLVDRRRLERDLLRGFVRVPSRPQVRRVGHRQRLMVATHRFRVVRGKRRRREKRLRRDGVHVGRAPASNLDPDVVAAARDDDGKVLVGEIGTRRQLVLNRAEFIQRVLRLDRQQLLENAVHGLERQAARREVDLPGRRHHVRLLADVDHARLAVEPDDRLKQ